MYKNVWVLFFLLMSLICLADLNVFVDKTRFLNDENNTILNIDYQIPYRDLQFSATDNGFEANLQVNLTISDSGKNVYKKTFTNRIILTQYPATISDDLYSDRISMTLSKSGFKISILFQDLLSGNSKEWEYNFETLTSGNLLSDLEFSSQVKNDTTDFMNKFHRGNLLFFHNSNHIYMLPNDDTLFIYSEYRNYRFGKDNKYNLKQNILIKKNGITVYKKKKYFQGSEKYF